MRYFLSLSILQKEALSLRGEVTILKSQSLPVVDLGFVLRPPDPCLDFFHHARAVPISSA